MSESGQRPTAARAVPSLDEWRRLEPMLDAILDAAPDRRASLLAELSAGDPSLRSELEHLVTECANGYPLIERPVADRFGAVFSDAPQPLPEMLAEKYRVTREVGRGGMAVVYLARDLKHGRDVAVKVVRAELAAALGRSRFLREIEIAAGLRHPNIVPLYDSGELPADGGRNPILYYVMPYEAGRSLRDRLAQDGPLPIESAMFILHDVCEALAHAHQHGIVHRDIKPGNVLLSGKRAMIADFGVARAVSEAASDAPLAIAGLALGTPAYMAPEQAANDPTVDHRADIYAVGVLAYELLAGRPPFDDGDRGGARAHALGAVKPLSSVRGDVPAALADLIMKCLATRPADRWQSAGELLPRLEAIAAAQGVAPLTGRSRLTGARAATVASVVLAAALAVLAIGLARSRDERPPFTLGRASQLTSEPGLEVQPSLSPDGSQVAYAAGNSLQMRIVVRPVAGGRAVNLTPDSSANEWLPRWSPDGKRILFLANGGAFSAPSSGGRAREEVASRPGAIVRSATWSADGREIAWVRGDSLQARTIGSQSARTITTGADLHSCTWSPNGALLACVSGNSFYVTVGSVSGVGPMFSNLAPSRIVLVPAGGGRAVSVTDSVSLNQSPAWSRDGRTLYFVSNRNGPRDVYAIAVSGLSAAGGDPLRVTTGIGAHSIAFSADGAQIVYAVYGSSANVWSLPIPTRPPASTSSAVPVTTGNQTVEGIRVSPNGRWLIYDSDLSGNSDIYRVPVGGGDVVRLTRSPLDEFRGALSPNGRELVFHSYQTGTRNLFLLSLGGGPVKQLTRSSRPRSMANWSPDGTALTFFDIANSEIMVMRRDSGGRWGAPRVIASGGLRPEWSPDGRAIAFVSPADGRIAVVPPDSGLERDIYVPGIGDPLAELAIFAASGREIYFKSHDARGRASFWSVPVAGGRPRLLARFDDPARASNRFEFASDGRNFYFTLEDRQSDIWIADIAAR